MSIKHLISSSPHVLMCLILLCCLVFPFYSSDNSLPDFPVIGPEVQNTQSMFSHYKMNCIMVQFDPDLRLFSLDWDPRKI